MALKVPPDKVQDQPADTILLELAMYNHYTWLGVTYEKGTAYKFKRDDALALMAEQDYGRPIWRQYRAPKPKVAAKMPIVDSTEVQAVRARISLEDAAARGNNTGKRIEVGTDDEIAEILNKPDVDTSEDVTV